MVEFGDVNGIRICRILYRGDGACVAVYEFTVLSISGRSCVGPVQRTMSARVLLGDIPNSDHHTLVLEEGVSVQLQVRAVGALFAGATAVNR